MQSALRTEVRRYNVAGELHFANSTEPSVPAAIEPLVMGVAGLDDFHAKPAQARRVTPSAASARGSISPRFNNPSGVHYLAPDDLATIYNVKPLYAGGYDGSGQRIVVTGESDVDLTDIQAFRALYGLPQNDPQFVLVPGLAYPGFTVSEQEADLDIEWSGAVARNAKIIYVYSVDARFAVFYAIDQNLAPIITFSFGLCESQNPQALMSFTRAYAQQANAQGITWLAATLDSGAAGCDPALSPRTSKASLGLAVSFPASLPEVTAVGGTQFDDASGDYWATSNSGSLASALSYIPEKGWNESGHIGLAATGGGLSKVFTRPVWQTGPGVPSANLRAIPDVSLSAASHDGYLVFSGGGPNAVAGTSAAAPAFAGILALVNQYQELNGVETRSGQGNINPNLYRLAETTPGVFHDVTAGDNIVPCVSGTPDCFAGTLGYTAGPGYDPVTGLGSVDAFNLAVNLTKQWVTPTISVLSPASIITGAGSFTLAVTGSGFDAGSVVQWAGTPLPTTYLSGTQLIATVSASLSASPGFFNITVVSSAGTSVPVVLGVIGSFGATFKDQRVTRTAPPPTGCSVPSSVSSFGISDNVFLYYSAVVNTNSSLSDDWLAPNGVVVPGDTWPASVAGNFCFPDSSLDMSTIPFNPIGTWQVRVYDHGDLLFAVPFTIAASTNQTTVLAHAADGNAFKTTVLLTNASSVPAPYSLRFNDDHGNIPATRFELEAGSLTGIIPANGSVTIRTAGLGPATVNGWAELTAPPAVGGSVIYSQKTANLPSLQEGTSTIVASGSQHFFMPFDNTSKAITGVALTNAGATAASNISVTFRYADGSPPETLSFPQLASRNHQAFVLASQFPHTANRSGLAEFTSDAALSVAVFRFNSTGAFTALDATPAGAPASSVTRTLAHAADGDSFKTTVLLTNAGSAAASYTLRFNDDHGNVPATRFELEAGSLTGNIAAGGSVTVQTAGQGSQTVSGWAELTAPLSVGGSVIYSQKTNLPSIQEGTATIVASGSSHFWMPFDNTEGAIAGVALTNPGASPASISVTIRYNDGTPAERASYPGLASRNHQAFVLASQFPNTAGRSGVLEFTATSPLSAVEFRFNSTGGFTSLGIVAAP